MARPQPQPTKSKAHKASDDLQVERLHQGYAQSMEITKVLADEQSQFQHIKIFDTVANGRVMTLDDIVQITDRDESAYADMLTHLPMLEHGKVERVMIVGGGDLSIADEALKHKGVKEVVLVDIDGRVIALCKKLFGNINMEPTLTSNAHTAICNQRRQNRRQLCAWATAIACPAPAHTRNKLKMQLRCQVHTGLR